MIEYHHIVSVSVNKYLCVDTLFLIRFLLFDYPMYNTKHNLVLTQAWQTQFKTQYKGHFRQCRLVGPTTITKIPVISKNPTLISNSTCSHFHHCFTVRNVTIAAWNKEYIIRTLEYFFLYTSTLHTQECSYCPYRRRPLPTKTHGNYTHITNNRNKFLHPRDLQTKTQTTKTWLYYYQPFRHNYRVIYKHIKSS